MFEVKISNTFRVTNCMSCPFLEWKFCSVIMKEIIYTNEFNPWTQIHNDCSREKDK